MNDTRRTILKLAALSPFLAAGVAAAADAGAPVCFDPQSLTLSQKSRRRAVGYVEPSAEPAKHCSACAFFSATQSGCGTCAILAGPVSGGAVCTSFAPKAAK